MDTVHNSLRWFQAASSRYGGGGYHQDVKTSRSELWFKCCQNDHEFHESSWCRLGCQWDLLLGFMGYFLYVALQMQGVETGKSFPCVQALADRRALMTRLERTKLLVPRGSWIRVEQNTFWIALLCFWLLDFVSESLVSIEHNRTQTIDAHCVVKSIVLNVSQKHLALRACAMQLFDNCRVHLQFESSRFEVVQLYKQGNNWISSTSKYLQHVQSFHLVRWVNVTYLRLLSC